MLLGPEPLNLSNSDKAVNALRTELVQMQFENSYDPTSISFSQMLLAGVDTMSKSCRATFPCSALDRPRQAVTDGLCEVVTFYKGVL